jgi:cytochrome P450
MLIEYFDEETNQGLSEKELRDEMTTIFMAGYETISQTLNWIFYHLAKEKKIARKVKMEAVDLVKGQSISINDLHHLKFTKQVIQEALRCYPSIYALVRKPYYDDEINGIKIPASSNVLINIYGMHHHPQYWNTPGDFNPGRFNDAGEEQRIPFVYLPFGGGPRLCIGNNFAMMVMQVVVSRLSLFFEFDVPENYEPKIEPNITMRVKGQMKLIIMAKE